MQSRLVAGDKSLAFSRLLLLTALDYLLFYTYFCIHVILHCHLFLLFEALCGFWRYWKSLGGSGMVWKVLECSAGAARFGEALGGFERLREALGYFVRF